MCESKSYWEEKWYREKDMKENEGKKHIIIKQKVMKAGSQDNAALSTSERNCMYFT